MRSDHETDLDTAINEAAQNGELTSDQIRALFERLSGLTGALADEAFETVEDALLSAMPDLAGLQVRPGGWIVDLRASATRTVLAAALVGGVMMPAGLDQLPAYVLPAVLPLLVDVRKARLSRGDDKLLLELRRSQTPSQAATSWTSDALYGRLPAAVQQQVSPIDFADFVDRLVQAGEADDADFDEIAVRPADGRAWIRISFE